MRTFVCVLVFVLTANHTARAGQDPVTRPASSRPRIGVAFGGGSARGLAHVGVVADEHGFYHASRRHGVIYSPFNEYWTKRIDGFRKVPAGGLQITD